jgi:uncharacterized membrane protein
MDNIFHTTKPFLIILKAFGIFPANLDGSHGRSFWTIAASFLSLCLFLFIVALNFEFYEPIETSSNIVKNSFHIALGIGLTSLGVTTVYQWRKVGNIVRFLKLVNEFDSKVCRNHENYRQIHNQSFLPLVVNRSSGAISFK